ncbi:hypothetical protein [Bacillus sp. FJAT-45037]|uniref:hypothetical protein n=1 Tax=Bacillus sp. FJAT-45037 TaxID=2011007 RepID=UPI000C24F024|nr:hypothetical protein [Bacillus sp. FJAT-45037]
MPATNNSNEIDEYYQTYTHLNTDTLREVIEQHIDELEEKKSKSVSKRLEAAIKVYLDRTKLE